MKERIQKEYYRTIRLVLKSALNADNRIDHKITVPVIIGALGLVNKGTVNYIGKIPGNIRITDLQKTVLLGTAHILRRHYPSSNLADFKTALSSCIELSTIKCI